MHITNIKTFNRFKAMDPFNVTMSKNMLIIGDNSSGKTTFGSILDYIRRAAEGSIRTFFEQQAGFDQVVKDTDGFKIEIETSPVFEGKDIEKDALTYILKVSAVGKGKTIEPTKFRVEEEILGNYARVKTGERAGPLKFIEVLPTGRHFKFFSDAERSLVNFQMPPIGTGLSTISGFTGQLENPTTKRFAQNLLAAQLSPELGTSPFFTKYGNEPAYTQAIDAVLSGIESGYESLLFDSMSRVMVRYRDGTTIPFGLAGSGFTSFVDYASNILDNMPRTMFFDNVDKHLNPIFLSALSRLIKASPQHQYVLTSKNTGVASEFDWFHVIGVVNSQYHNIAEDKLTQWLDKYDDGLLTASPLEYGDDEEGQNAAAEALAVIMTERAH